MTKVKDLVSGHNRETRERCVTFSQDGTLLAIGNRDNKVSVWNGQNGTILQSMKAEESNAIVQVSLPPALKTEDGGAQILVAGDESGYVHLWNAATGALVKKIETQFGFGVNAFGISADGKTLGVAASDRIYVVDLPSGDLRWESVNLSEEISNQCDVTPDGKWLILADREGRFSMWSTDKDADHAAPNKLVELNKEFRFKALNPLTISPCGKYAAVAGVPEVMYIVDLDSCQGVREFPPIENAGGHDEIRWSADGKTIFTSHHQIGGNGKLYSRSFDDPDPKNAKLLHAFEIDSVFPFDIRPTDGAIVVGGIADYEKTNFKLGLIKEAASGKSDLAMEDFCLGSYAGDYISAWPGGAGFVMAKSDGSVAVLDAGGSPITSFTVEDGVEKCRVSPDGKLVAFYKYKNFALHTVVDGKEVFCSNQLTADYIYSMEFTPCSQYVLLGEEKKSISLVSLSEKRVVWKIDKAHKEEPQGIAVNAAGTLFFTGGDKIGKLWKFSTTEAPAEPVKEFSGHSDSIRCCKFISLKNGQEAVISADLDGHIILWNLETGEKLATFDRDDADILDIDTFNDPETKYTTFFAVADYEGKLFVAKIDDGSDDGSDWSSVYDEVVTPGSFRHGKLKAVAFSKIPTKEGGKVQVATVGEKSFAAIYEL